MVGGAQVLRVEDVEVAAVGHGIHRSDEHDLEPGIGRERRDYLVAEVVDPFVLLRESERTFGEEHVELVAGRVEMAVVLNRHGHESTLLRHGLVAGERQVLLREILGINIGVLHVGVQMPVVGIVGIVADDVSGQYIGTGAPCVTVHGGNERLAFEQVAGPDER